jgi:hypothetical protein
MIKEFQYTLYDSKAIENDDWVTQNLNEDDKFTQKVAKDKLGQIKSRGLKIASLDSVGYQFQKIVESFSDVLTFPADKTRQNKIGRVFDQIGDAEYLLVYARNSEAVGRLDLFRELVASTIADSPNLKPSIITELRSSYAALAYVMPDDPLFYVKSAVSDVLSGLLDGTDEDLIEKFGLIRDYMNYAYRMADSNPVLARTALEDYSSRFIAFTAAEKNNLQRVKNLIAEENQVMDYLLRQFAIFYQDKYFGIKHSLETTWLSLLPEGSDKNEEKQTIISNKIDFLKDLQQFFLDEKVVLSDAIDVVSRLMSEIGDIEPNAELGINQIIALRLNDYDQFLRFLNEVKKGTLQGTTMKDKYDAFLLTQKGQTPPADITETIRELTGEKPVAVELTADQILAQIEKDFADAGITDLRLGQMTGAAQQYITVENASLENIIFSGRYDWNKKQMLDLLSGRSTVTTRAVNLSDLAGILVPEPIQTQVETQPVVIPQTQIVHPASQTQIVQPTQQTQAVSPSASKSELVAKILAIQKLKSNDVKVTEDGITVTNLQNGISFIDNAILISHPEVTFSFTYDSKAGEALDVILHTSAGDRPVDSLILLADLSKAVFQASQASAGLQNSTTQNP